MPFKWLYWLTYRIYPYNIRLLHEWEREGLWCALQKYSATSIHENRAWYHRRTERSQILSDRALYHWFRIDTMTQANTDTSVKNHPPFILLADNTIWGKYKMESTVLANETQGKVWKIYDSLDYATIERYHQIHDSLSLKEYTLDIDWEFEYLWQPIRTLIFRVHPLGNEISRWSSVVTKQAAVITELEYVPWTSLEEGMISMPKNLLTTPWNDMDAFLRGMDYELFWLPLRQLHAPNIKIKEFNPTEWKMSLTITDLGWSIERFVEQVDDRERSIIRH